MIALNGKVGLTLLIGGLKYKEHDYNLQGANSFLAVILPLAVIGLVLPNYTRSSPNQTFSPIQTAFLIIVSVALYGIFLTIQNRRHRAYFRTARPTAETKDAKRKWQIVHEVHSVPYHILLLLAYMVPLMILTQHLAVPIDFTIRVLGAPVALAGLIIAMLVLTPSRSEQCARHWLATCKEPLTSCWVGARHDWVDDSCGSYVRAVVPQTDYSRPGTRRYHAAVVDFGIKHHDVFEQSH